MFLIAAVDQPVHNCRDHPQKEYSRCLTIHRITGRPIHRLTPLPTPFRMFPKRCSTNCIGPMKKFSESRYEREAAMDGATYSNTPREVAP